jgi:hypothetical protein
MTFGYFRMNKDLAFSGVGKVELDQEKGARMATFLTFLNTLGINKSKNNEGLRVSAFMVFDLHIES